jgi:hypothetical protein
MGFRNDPHIHMPSSATSPHIWKFFRTGGIDQVSLETGADLLNLGSSTKNSGSP